MRFKNMQDSQQVHHTSNTVEEFIMVNITFMYNNVQHKDMRGNFSIMQKTLMKLMFTQDARHTKDSRVLGENADRRLFHGFVLCSSTTSPPKTTGGI